ncbi:MAG: PEP-CTERM sorting domain-containing protein [Planctomycetota bacterium]
MPVCTTLNTTSAFSAATLLAVCCLAPTNAHAVVINYELKGTFDSPPEISGFDDNQGQDLDTTEWGLSPELFGQSFTLTFDVDEATPRTSVSGGGSASFNNFDSAASNISLEVGGTLFASVASGDVSQVLASASHTWSLDSPEATLADPPLELFDFDIFDFTGFTVGQPFLSLALIDSDQTAYSSGADELIRLSEAEFLGDLPVGFITDSLTLFLSNPGDDGVFIDYSITGTINSITVVPEPASLALLGLGGLMFARRRRD